MKLPALTGIIDRRILINYRIDPVIVKRLLPPHLEPLIVNGYASGGICLLRLKNIGPKFMPSILRITSENAAHRFLVTMKKEGKKVSGVYIPRRDTDSKLNVVVAGKVFSWPHFAAEFEVHEGDGRYFIKMQSKDGHTSILVDAEITDSFPADSMFTSREHASCRFRDAPIGVSPSTKTNEYKTIELSTKTWETTPLALRHLKTSYFEDKSMFPDGSTCFDNAMLMEGIEHEWLTR